MVTTAASVDWVTVSTEVAALQLEYSWIKEYDPRFNVRYRDDKSYPYLAVTLDEEFPRLQVMRGAKRKGDARSAAARLPGPDVLGRCVQASRADRPPVPARLHRQVLRALHRPC